MITFNRPKRGAENPGHLKVRNWTPRHTAIVMDWIQGDTYTTLAERYNLSEGMIGTIVSSRQGKTIRAAVDQRVLAEKYDNIPEQRKQGIIKAQQRILEFLEDDELQARAPLLCAPLNIRALDSFVAADKISPTINGNVTYNTQVNVLNSETKRDALAEGLRRAQLVEELHKSVTGQSVGENLEEVKVALVK